MSWLRSFRAWSSSCISPFWPQYFCNVWLIWATKTDIYWGGISLYDPGCSGHSMSWTQLLPKHEVLFCNKMLPFLLDCNVYVQTMSDHQRCERQYIFHCSPVNDERGGGPQPAPWFCWCSHEGSSPDSADSALPGSPPPPCIMSHHWWRWGPGLLCHQ